MTFTNGQYIGPYGIIKQAGKGEMGEVYQAKDTRLDRIVAIKVPTRQQVDLTKIKKQALEVRNHLEEEDF